MQDLSIAGPKAGARAWKNLIGHQGAHRRGAGNRGQQEGRRDLSTDDQYRPILGAVRLDDTFTCQVTVGSDDAKCGIYGNWHSVRRLYARYPQPQYTVLARLRAGWC